MEAAGANMPGPTASQEVHRRSRNAPRVMGCNMRWLEQRVYLRRIWSRQWKPLTQTCQVRRHRKSGIEGRGRLATISAMKLAILSTLKAATSRN